MKTLQIALATALTFFRTLFHRRPDQLQEKHRELEAAYKKLQAVEKQKDDFFANVSHELRTPLTLILAPLESLLSNEFGDLDNRQRDALQIMHNNSVRLLQLITGLLDFSRLNEGKLEALREPTDIVTLSESIFSDFGQLMRRKGIEGGFRADVAIRTVQIDRYLFERILFNLLSNAVKFTPEGGKIWIGLEAKGNEITVSVRDTGIGISPEDQTTLFEKFTQTQSSASRRFEGAGLGLALVKEFASLLGGSVSVSSELGKGALFTVKLMAPPANSAESEEARRGLTVHISPIAAVDTSMETLGNAHDSSPHGAQAKVLIVEDNLELAGYIASLLKPLACTRHAADGKHALAMARDWGPDIILSDVMVPDIDGFSLCRTIKSDPHTASIPVIMLTALTHREALLKGWESGADEYLLKPFHPKELFTRVKSMITLVQERRRREEEKKRREEMEDFTYYASHDLKEPLRMVTIYSQLLQAQFGKELGPSAEGYLQYIVTGAVRIQQLLDDLISYSLVAADPSVMADTDAELALVQAIENLEVTIRESKAAISYGRLPHVSSNSAQLTQVFQNLISNAIKYRREASPVVRIEAKDEAGEWIFCVKDNGMGFEPRYAERIFVIFKRLHSSKNYPGTGIGLAICKKIIQRNGGRIWAESTPGEGSTFYFTLPPAIAQLPARPRLETAIQAASVA